jgi:hypothetical protein
VSQHLCVMDAPAAAPQLAMRTACAAEQPQQQLHGHTLCSTHSCQIICTFFLPLGREMCGAAEWCRRSPTCGSSSLLSGHHHTHPHTHTCPPSPPPPPAGLHIDPNNQQMKAALSDALSAKNRPPAGGGLFGPDALMRLAMDPRTRHLMDDKVGVCVGGGATTNKRILV